MSQLVLPDCRALRPPTGLSARQRRDLVRLLAEEGPEAIEAWLRREEKADPDIRERLEAERAKLEREARAEQRRMEARQRGEDEEQAARWRERIGAAHHAEEELKERMRTAREGPLVTEQDLMERSALFKAVLEQQAAPRRHRPTARLRRAWLWLVALWVRIVRWITGRKGIDARRVVTLPEGAHVDLGPIGPDVVLALEDAPMTWQERLRRAWRRASGQEDPADAVRKKLDAERRRVEDERRREREEEERVLRERLEAAREQERRMARQSEEERIALARRHERERAELAKRQRLDAWSGVGDAMRSEMHEMGMLDDQGRATLRLVEGFSRMLYDEARRLMPAAGASVPGTYVEGEGEYELGRMLSTHELGSMDLMATVVHARTHHPRTRHIQDEDVLVHREVRSSRAHVVVVFDTSGSMEEHGRLDAAKRVCLVLERAVKDQNPDHHVDLLAMHTSVESVDLRGCWNAKPRGFTNHGAAFRMARRMFEEHPADTRLLYFVTDGLPEAYTRKDGTDVADRPDVCMEDALREARLLGQRGDVRTVILQLETRQEMYLDSAARLAAAADGEVQGIDPADLMRWVMGDVDRLRAPG